MICRSVDEAYAAGCADGQHDPPLTQNQADYIAAIIAAARQPARAAA